MTGMHNPFELPPRKALTGKRRAEFFLSRGGLCDECGVKLMHLRYEIDHVVALSLGGDNSDGNLRLLCIPCHREKTRSDVGLAAKGRRVAIRHLGAHRSSRPIPGSRASGWKRRMDGTWERRA